MPGKKLVKKIDPTKKKADRKEFTRALAIALLKSAKEKDNAVA